MQVLLQFLDACMLKQRLPDAASEKFQQLSSKQLEGLHKLIKELQVKYLPISHNICHGQCLLGWQSWTITQATKMIKWLMLPSMP